MWTPDPNLIVKRYASGSGNMGDVSDSTVKTARFKPGVRHVLTQAYVKFDGAAPLPGGGQGTATLQMWLDSKQGGDGIDSVHDRIIDEWLAMGYDSGADGLYADWAPEGGEFHRYVFDPGDEFVFTWTDPGTTDWSIMLAYQPLTGV